MMISKKAINIIHILWFSLFLLSGRFNLSRVININLDVRIIFLLFSGILIFLFPLNKKTKIKII